MYYYMYILYIYTHWKTHRVIGMIEYIVDVLMTGEATTSMMVSPWGQSASVLQPSRVSTRRSRRRSRDRFLPPKNQRFDRLTNLMIKHWEFKHQIEDFCWTKTGGVSQKPQFFFTTARIHASSYRHSKIRWLGPAEFMCVTFRQDYFAQCGFCQKGWVEMHRHFPCSPVSV